MKVSLEAMAGRYLDSLMPDEGKVNRFRESLKEALRRVGDRWRSESVANAPRSPLASMLKRLHKAGGNYTIAAKGTKPARAIKLTRFYRMSAAAIAEAKKGTLSGSSSALGNRLSGANWKNPGGLERSIQFESDGEKAEVFVASNAEAGEYAHIIHDMKGVKWHERGPGTQAKGDRADEKFIERAQPAAATRLEDFLGKSLKDLFGG